jgi:hypothetical protein
MFPKEGEFMDTKNLRLLRRLSTGELMTFLTNVRRTGGQWSPTGEYFTVDEILEVLKNRPHTPNKEEARMMRQLAARSRDNKHGRQDR